MLGFVVGLAISSQTFYSFILENLRNLGALKAMGASDRVLSRMVMLQTLTVGLIGYGCGVGLAMLFGMVLLKKGMPSFFLSWQLLAGGLARHPQDQKPRTCRGVPWVRLRHGLGRIGSAITLQQTPVRMSSRSRFRLPCSRFQRTMGSMETERLGDENLATGEINALDE